MQGPGHEFLSGSGRTLDEHIRVGPRRQPDQFVHLLHGRRIAGERLQPVFRIELGLEFFYFLLERMGLYRIGNTQFELIQVRNGLCEEIVRPFFHRFYGQIDASIRRQQDARELGGAFFGLFEERNAVHARHADIADHEREVGIRPDGVQRLFRIRRGQAGITVGKGARHDVPGRFFVVYNQDLRFGHGTSTFQLAYARLQPRQFDGEGRARVLHAFGADGSPVIMHNARANHEPEAMAVRLC